LRTPRSPTPRICCWCGLADGGSRQFGAAWNRWRVLLGRGGSVVGVCCIVVVLLVLEWWDVSDRGMEAFVVEPVHPGGGGILDFTPGGPGGLFVVDDLGLEQSDRLLHQRVIQRIAHGADRAGDPCLAQGFGGGQSGVRRSRTGA